jgi:hypothetical protein
MKQRPLMIIGGYTATDLQRAMQAVLARSTRLQVLTPRHGSITRSTIDHSFPARYPINCDMRDNGSFARL